MTDLPEALPSPFAVPIHQAYAFCVDLQSRNPPRPNSARSSLVCARFLGYMIREAPTAEGRLNFSNEVLSCEGSDQKLFELSELYFSHFVRFFLAAKGRTPAPSVHPSRPSFNNIRDMTNLVLEEAPQDHQTAKAHALVRDGHRCVLTGNYDKESFKQIASVKKECKESHGDITATVAAHILGGFTNAGISGAPEEEDERLGNIKRQYAATAWAILQRFGSINVDELNGVGVHRLENILTLDMVKHTFFDSLDIWLEPTDNVDCYKLNSTEPELISKLPAYVTFRSSDPRLPVPSPRYLHLHSACARVAHLSGAGQYIDSLIRDLEKRGVLAADGTSADALSYALSTISSR